MTDQATGLRFDIFERIELSEEVEGMERLEEIELTPQIQLTSDDEQAILRGNLLLTGSYVGEDLMSGHQLNHAIPVEITLPMNRVVDLDHIGVEIENFDVDVLSLRKLSVTGVLSLRGVETNVTEAKHQRTGLDNEHSVDKLSNDLVREFIADHQDERLPRVMEQEEQMTVNDDRPVETAGVLERDEAFDSTVLQPAQSNSHEPMESNSSRPSTVEASDGLENAEQSSIETERDQNEQAFILKEQTEELVTSGFEAGEGIDEFESHEETKQESIKVAFNSQLSAEQAILQSDSVQSLLASHRDENEGVYPNLRQAVEQVIEHNAENTHEDYGLNEPSDTGELQKSDSKTEWKNLLLSRDGSEEKQFSKMRLCIVQREDTLDTIAERYSLNPREIVLFNRLDQQEVAVGQIIYIPS